MPDCLVRGAQHYKHMLSVHLQSKVQQHTHVASIHNKTECGKSGAGFATGTSVMPCYAMLCHAVLYCAMLRYAVLCICTGEIIPQAVCSRHGLAVGAHSAWFVRILMVAFAGIAYPISKVLDYLLGAEHTVSL